jgi:hypothetical protein
MANTTIRLRKSGVTSNVPVSLELGELALNYADGKLYYKNALGTITYISSGASTNSFATINSNSSLIIATSNTDILSLVGSNNITINTDTINKVITIGASLTDSLFINSSSIGASANALTLGSGTINLSNPLTPIYNPSAIIAGQIGSAITPTYNTPFNLSPSVVKNIATYSLPIGVYFIQASIQTPTPVTYQGLGISSASATVQYECWSNILTDTYIWFALCVSRMVVITRRQLLIT